MANFRIETLKDISRLVKELATGLRALTFGENFDSFEVDITLTAGQENATIRNQLTIIPSRVINLGQSGNGVIAKGTTAWTNDYLSIINHGAVSVTVKLLFLR